jgi:hypothetical protein
VGLGLALMEETQFDERNGLIMEPAGCRMMIEGYGACAFR